MPFRWSATDPAANDIGPLYDVGFGTRDGSALSVLDRNLKPVSVKQMAYMVARSVGEQAFKEATELQEKAKLTQLGTSTTIDREFDQWPQNTQGDWSGGIGQRVYGQQGVTNEYFDGEGLLWPLNDWIPQLALRGPTQGIPSAGIAGPTSPDSATQTIQPGGALAVLQACAALATLKAAGAPALVGVKGPFLQGSNVAVAPAFGQATIAGHMLTCKVTGQRQQLGAATNIGDTGAATFSFDFSGANTDNIVGGANTFSVPASGAYFNSVTCYMGGHTANVTTEFVIWNANTGAVLAVTAATSLGTGRASRTLSFSSPVFIAGNTVIRIGFWRNASQDAEWGVASSGSFVTATNASGAVMPSTGCANPYVCGNPQFYATYQVLNVSEIAQSNAGAAPGWVKVVQQNSPDGYQSCTIWKKENCGNGETAPQFAAAQGASPMDAQLAEWSNVATASSTDQTGTASNSNQTSLTVTAGALDAIAGDLVLVAMRWSLNGSGTASFTQAMNNATPVHLGDSGGTSRQQHSSFDYGIIPTGIAAWSSWAINGTCGGYIEGLGMGYAVTYLDNQGPPGHWHATFFAGDQIYDLDIGANTGSKQGPIHMHIGGGYLWILFSEYPNANNLTVRMLGCAFGSNTFTQLRNDSLLPTTATTDGFSGVIQASYVGGKLYVGVLQGDRNLPPGAPTANPNGLYVLDYSAGTATSPSGSATPIFVFPFVRGFHLVDLCWQGSTLGVSVSDGLGTYIYTLTPPFTSISTAAVIPGIANAYMCSVGSTFFIVGWTAGPAGSGINRMDLYTLDGSTLTEIPFTPIQPFLDSVTSPTAFGGYAFWTVANPVGAGPQKSVTVYAYDIVRSRLFRALTFTDPSWTGNDVFAHDVLGIYGVTSRTQVQGAATFQAQFGMAIFSGLLNLGGESAREFYWGVTPITPAPSFSGLLQTGVDIISGLFDFTAATNKLFRAVLSHFINGLVAGASSPAVVLNVWFDQDPNRVAGVAPDITATTAPAPNPLPAQLDLNLFANRVARKLVYEVISSGGGFDGAVWRNAPKITDIIVQASTGWVWDMVLNVSPGARTNSNNEYAYTNQSPTDATADSIDQVVAYNFLRALWRQKGGECVIFLSNGDTYNALIQLEEFAGAKPYAVSARSDQETQYQELVTVKVREDI